MQAIEQLKKEHRSIREVLKILGNMTQKLEAGDMVDTHDLEAVREVLQIFIGACHHTKEETVLLPALAEVGMPASNSLIDSILTDHELARAWVEAFAEGVVDYKEGETVAVPKIIENAHYYLSLLEEHLKKEDFGLFPLADTLLDDQEQIEMLKEFVLIEREKIGEGKHDGLQKTIWRLQEIYPEKGENRKRSIEC